ncbi:MAG: T9SS type A sorting domain-containing protein [Bacteroidales bacterium]|nr:T9SS type A sorting domain-containing protein [Bacteroidales bacterium]
MKNKTVQGKGSREVLTYLSIVFSLTLRISEINAQQPVVRSMGCQMPLGVYCTSIAPCSNGNLFARSGRSHYGIFSGIPDIVISRVDNSGNEIWQKTYGGTEKEYVVQIEQQSNERYYVLGATESTDGHVQSGNKGGFDIWLFAIDTSGNLLWERTYGTAGDDYPVRVAKLPDGSLVVCANIYQQGGDVDTAYGDADMWFFRVDSLGNILWQKTLGAEGLNSCNDFIINDKGNIVLTGTNVGDYFSGCYAPQNQSIMLMEVDLEGKKLWNRCYGSWSPDYGGVVTQCQDGYVFAARVYGDGEYVEGYHHNPNTSQLYSDIWLVRTDWQGFILWKKCLGGSNEDVPVSLITDDAGDIYLFGNTKSYDYDVIRMPGNNGNNVEIWMLKYFSTGELIYQRGIGGNKDDWLSSKSSVYYDGHKGFKLLANTNTSKSGDVTCEYNYYPTYYFSWLVDIERCKESEAGVPGQPEGDTAVFTLSEPETQYQIQPSENNWRFDWQLEPPEAGRITNLGLKARVAWQKGYNGEALLRARAYSVCGYSEWTTPLKINVEEAYGITENAIAGIKLYPNPASGPVTLQLPSCGPFTLTLRDISGRILSTHEATGGTHLWDASGLQAGMYIMEISNPYGLSTRIKLLIAR